MAAVSVRVFRQGTGASLRAERDHMAIHSDDPPFLEHQQSLVVHFDKDWEKISEIEEYRLDWSGR
jgi:hypothetical protein